MTQLNSNSADLDSWLARLEKLQPDRIELGLTRVRAVLQRLKPDLSATTVISVAGTNGKGSVVAYLEAIYQQQGISTLAYTSPHILEYNERIRINGQQVTGTELCIAFTQVENARRDTALTYFEFGTLAAIALLNAHQPAVAIMEVGLGGRLDAVNVLDADLAIITSIGIDHTEWLGPDRSSIAGEKIGIARTGKPLLCGDLEPPKIIAAQAEAAEIPLYQLGQDFTTTSANGVIYFDSEFSKQSINISYLEQLPKHQINNALLAIMAVTMHGTGLPRIDIAGLQSDNWVQQLPGRMQRLAERPLVILDVAHNPHAAAALATALQMQSGYSRTIAVLAMLNDKDAAGVVNALDAVIDHWYLAPTGGSRGLSALQLQQAAAKSTQTASTTVQSVAEGLAQAHAEAGLEDRIIVLGSFSNAAALLERNLNGSST